MDESLDSVNEQRRSRDLRMLKMEVLMWKIIVFGSAVCFVGAYVYYFGVRLQHPLAIDPDKWGAFGDFVGGVMNPIVAFAAFYWLTESVKIQKTELAETRAELTKATSAQNELVKNGRDSVKLSALTALLNANNTKIDLCSNKIDKLEAWLSSNTPGGVMYSGDVASQARAQKKWQNNADERDLLLNSLESLESRNEELQRLIEKAL